MVEKLKALFRKYHDIFIYLVFGVLTTAVNYAVYLPVYNLLGLSAAASNAVAWIVAVVFAFVTNKPLVFRSFDWSAGTLIPELTAFIGTRLGSGALETGILYLLADVLGLNGNFWKIITSVLVVALNYIGSKLLVFQKK